MSEESPQLPEVGPWALDKLERLRKYLSAYTTILRKQNLRYVYIDALAGAGQSLLRGDAGARQVLEGSPRVALNIKHPFRHYVFIEKDRARATELRKLKEEYGSTRRVTVVEGGCGAYLLDLANKRKQLRGWRGVVFLDPFGMQVPWEILASLGGTGVFEVILNLPIGMAIQRLMPRQLVKLTAERRARLDGYFGDPGWFDVVYPEDNTLFGLERIKTHGSSKKLVEWYRGRLSGPFGLVSPAHLVRNTQGGHLYYLIRAGPNATGLKIASDVLLGPANRKP